MLRIKYSHKRKNIPYHDISPIFCNDKFHSDDTVCCGMLSNILNMTFHHYLDIGGGGGGALSKGGVGFSITASAWDEAEAGTGSGVDTGADSGAECRAGALARD